MDWNNLQGNDTNDLNKFMTKPGYVKSKYDHYVYLHKLLDEFFIYLLLYVDDMLIASKS